MSSKGSIWKDTRGLHIRQGRYGELTIPLTNADGTAYVMNPTDILKFTIRTGPRISEDEPPKIIQKIKTGVNIVTIDPADTEELQCGAYLYDVTLYQLGTKPIPVIDPDTVYIEEVIT